MKFQVIIDENCEERIVVYAKKSSPLIRQLQQLVEENSIDLTGYQGTKIVKLNPNDIFCITVIQNKVYALCRQGQFQLKQRLYVLEQALPENFVKINQSCIANIRNIAGFDASISGTLKVRFQNGYTDYVSRRQLKSVKERLGI